MEEGILKIKDDNDKEKTYNILFTFDEKESNKSYIVYTDYSINENGNINIYSNLYVEENERIRLLPIENMEIKEYINKKLEEIGKELIP